MIHTATSNRAMRLQFAVAGELYRKIRVSMLNHSLSSSSLFSLPFFFFLLSLRIASEAESLERYFSLLEKEEKDSQDRQRREDELAAQLAAAAEEQNNLLLMREEHNREMLRQAAQVLYTVSVMLYTICYMYCV